MRVLDAASGLLARLQELAVLGANNTNTTADHEAINSEAEALGDEFNRLMTKSTYKGKNVFVAAAGGEYVAMGGRSAEMSFGIKTIDYSALYTATATSIAAGPTSGIKTINLRVLPSEAVIARADASDANSNTEVLTSKVEAVQKLINAARVQAGSQYAAIESAVSYATDLTAQYELGYNAVSDVNFSMETAHLAKNQILQQAATAMLAQANSGQQGLLQLINN
jgi:flagellin